MAPFDNVSEAAMTQYKLMVGPMQWGPQFWSTERLQREEVPPPGLSGPVDPPRWQLLFLVFLVIPFQVAYTEGHGFRATCTAESVHNGDALTHICIGVLYVSRIA